MGAGSSDGGGAGPGRAAGGPAGLRGATRFFACAASAQRDGRRRPGPLFFASLATARALWCGNCGYRAPAWRPERALAMPLARRAPLGSASAASGSGLFLARLAPMRHAPSSYA